MNNMRTPKEKEKIVIDLNNYDEDPGEELPYLINVQPKTTFNDFKQNINDKFTLKIYKADGKTEVTATQKIATGMIAVLYNGDTKVYEYVIVVKGDCNGDGEANFKDILKINKHKLKREKLTGAFLEAGDVNGDNVANFKDMIRINKFKLRRIQEL